MTQVNKILEKMEASLNGSIDGLQLDNTADVIEKNIVIEIMTDLSILVSEAQIELKTISLSGWVDVKDRLPNHTKEVLIIDANYDDYYGIGAYIKNEGWALQGMNFWKPTHWKELDKPNFK